MVILHTSNCLGEVAGIIPFEFHSSNWRPFLNPQTPNYLPAALFSIRQTPNYLPAAFFQSADRPCFFRARQFSLCPSWRSRIAKTSSGTNSSTMEVFCLEHRRSEKIAGPCCILFGVCPMPRPKSSKNKNASENQTCWKGTQTAMRIMF